MNRKTIVPALVCSLLALVGCETRTLISRSVVLDHRPDVDCLVREIRSTPGIGGIDVHYASGTGALVATIAYGFPETPEASDGTLVVSSWDDGSYTVALENGGINWSPDPDQTLEFMNRIEQHVYERCGIPVGEHRIRQHCRNVECPG